MDGCRVEYGIPFACDTFLSSAYNVSVAMEAAKVSSQMTSLWIKEKLSSAFMHLSECSNAK